MCREIVDLEYLFILRYIKGKEIILLTSLSKEGCDIYKTYIRNVVME